MRDHRIAIQGTQASFHDLAAKKFYGQDASIVECSTFRETCEKLCRNEADYAVMAIENAIAGSILSNYNLIREFGLSIIGEVMLKVELHLLALPGTSVGEIHSVISHPMAIAQCQDFLSARPGWKITEAADTASCASKIASGNLVGVAAIANAEAARKYGLQMVKRNIETSDAALTRFMILSKGGFAEGEADKASLCFFLRHEVGSLSDVLSVLKKNRVNLSKIQSVPMPGKNSRYAFHADVEWDDYAAYRSAIKKISVQTDEFVILGEYKKANV